MKELLQKLYEIGMEEPGPGVGELTKAVARGLVGTMLGPYAGLAKVATADMISKIKGISGGVEVKVEKDRVSYHNVVVPILVVYFCFEVLGDKAKLIWSSGEVGLVDDYNTIFIGNKKEKPYIAFRRKSARVGADLDEVVIYRTTGEVIPIIFKDINDLIKKLGEYKGKL